MIQLTLNGLRNAAWCATAFGIVACAATPLTAERLAVAQNSIERAEEAEAADFAEMELSAARSKYAAAQAAADQRDAELATMLAEQADVDAQLAEHTARAKQSEKLAAQMDAQMRELREESLRRSMARGRRSTAAMRVRAMRAGFVTMALAALAISATWGLVACETTPRKPADFTQARTAVEDAAAQPEVIRYAGPESRGRATICRRRRPAAPNVAADDAGRGALRLSGRAGRAHRRDSVPRSRRRARAFAPGRLERERILREARLAEARRARAAELVAGFVRDGRRTHRTRAGDHARSTVLFDKGRAKLPSGCRSLRSTRSRSFSPRIPNAACRSKRSPTAWARPRSISSFRRAAPMPSPWRSSIAASTPRAYARSVTANGSPRRKAACAQGTAGSPRRSHRVERCGRDSRASCPSPQVHREAHRQRSVS